MEKSKIKSVNWKHVWRVNCMALRTEKKLVRLLDDKCKLHDYGIESEERLQFARL